MQKNVENKLNERQEVVANDYPEIEFVNEYRNKEKPEYQWNPNDNLIVCLQFSPCKPFPEREFQKFIVEWQAEAFYLQLKVEGRHDEVESEINKEYESHENDDEGLPSYMKQFSTSEYQEPTQEVEYMRFIWVNGMYIERGDGAFKYQLEIESDKTANKIFVKCSGKSKPARDAFEYVISRLKLLSENVCVFIICTCKVCKKRGLERAHRIKIEHLENLRERYEPKIQCYGSGVLMRLDEISNVTRPKYKVTIINTVADESFCERAVRQFFPNDSTIIPEVSTRKQKLASEFEDEFARKVATADVIICLISIHLTGGEEEEDIKAREMLKVAAERFEMKECLLVFILLNAPSSGWDDIPPFNNIEIPKLNQTPLYNIENPEWSRIGEDLH